MWFWLIIKLVRLAPIIDVWRVYSWALSLQNTKILSITPMHCIIKTNIRKAWVDALRMGHGIGGYLPIFMQLLGWKGLTLQPWNSKDIALNLPKFAHYETHFPLTNKMIGLALQSAPKQLINEVPSHVVVVNNKVGAGWADIIEFHDPSLLPRDLNLNLLF